MLMLLLMMITISFHFSSFLLQLLTFSMLFDYFLSIIFFFWCFRLFHYAFGFDNTTHANTLHALRHAAYMALSRYAYGAQHRSSWISYMLWCFAAFAFIACCVIYLLLSLFCCFTLITFISIFRWLRHYAMMIFRFSPSMPCQLFSRRFSSPLFSLLMPCCCHAIDFRFSLIDAADCHYMRGIYTPFHWWCHWCRHADITLMLLPLLPRFHFSRFLRLFIFAFAAIDFHYFRLLLLFIDYAFISIIFFSLLMIIRLRYAYFDVFAFRCRFRLSFDALSIFASDAAAAVHMPWYCWLLSFHWYYAFRWFSSFAAFAAFFSLCFSPPMNTLRHYASRYWYAMRCLFRRWLRHAIIIALPVISIFYWYWLIIFFWFVIMPFSPCAYAADADCYAPPDDATLYMPWYECCIFMRYFRLRLFTLPFLFSDYAFTLFADITLDDAIIFAFIAAYALIVSLFVFSLMLSWCAAFFCFLFSLLLNNEEHEHGITTSRTSVIRTEYEQPDNRQWPTRLYIESIFTTPCRVIADIFIFFRFRLCHWFRYMPIAADYADFLSCWYLMIFDAAYAAEALFSFRYFCCWCRHDFLISWLLIFSLLSLLISRFSLLRFDDADDGFSLIFSMLIFRYFFHYAFAMLFRFRWYYAFALIIAFALTFPLCHAWSIRLSLPITDAFIDSRRISDFFFFSACHHACHHIFIHCWFVSRHAAYYAITLSISIFFHIFRFRFSAMLFADYHFRCCFCQHFFIFAMIFAIDYLERHCHACFIFIDWLIFFCRHFLIFWFLLMLFRLHYADMMPCWAHDAIFIFSCRFR